MPVLIDLGGYHIVKNGWCVRNSGSHYTNNDAVEKGIRYVTRTRNNESRRNELIGAGGAGISVGAPVEEIIKEFQEVQQFYGIDSRGGRRIGHWVFLFNDKEINAIANDMKSVNMIARAICSYLFTCGFQSVYAIHYDPQKKVHIHIVINAVSYFNGRKFHVSKQEFAKMSDVFTDYYWKEVWEKTSVSAENYEDIEKLME